MSAISLGESLLDHEWNEFPFDWDEFLTSRQCERLRYYLRRVHRVPSMESFIHGISHTERVAFHCAVMAWQEDIDDGKTDVLIIAGLYHDIGRRGDSYDPEHGARSAEILDKWDLGLADDERDLLLALVDCHCRDVPEYLVNRKGLLSLSSFLRYLMILKDADALDRVRLSNRECILLRTDTGRMMKAFAAEVFSKYWRLKDDQIYYHLTTPTAAESIFRDGLQSSGRYIFFAETPEDCMQLAPICGSYWAIRAAVEPFVRSLRRLESVASVEIKLSLLSVNLKGYAEYLWRRINVGTEEFFMGRRWIGVYEFLLDQSVPPDRIIKVESVSMTMDVPESMRDALQNLF